MTNRVPHYIFIIDSHLWVLRALSQFIQLQTDFIVSQMSTDWRTLLAQESTLRPKWVAKNPGAGSPAEIQHSGAQSVENGFGDPLSVILLDWESPGIGRASLNMIRSTTSHVKIIAMGVWLSSRRNALAAGVDGFINKTDSPEQLLTVLWRVGQSEIA